MLLLLLLNAALKPQKEYVFFAGVVALPGLKLCCTPFKCMQHFSSTSAARRRTQVLSVSHKYRQSHICLRRQQSLGNKLLRFLIIYKHKSKCCMQHGHGLASINWIVHKCEWVQNVITSIYLSECSANTWQSVVYVR